MMNEISLSNGLSVPAIGLGANGIWAKESEDAKKLIEAQYNIYSYAIKNKICKLFDTSGAYGYNEEILGDALKNCGRHEDVLLMSKVSNSSQRKDVREGFERSLKRLGVDYLDIYLIHWPQTGTFIDTYLEMEKLYNEGLVKAIGVCNFNIHHLEELMQKASIVPMINQFELHPLLTQDNLVNYCYYKDIKVMAYSPIARMHDVLIKAKPIYELSKKYDKTPAQIILRWHYQLNHFAIPKTTNEKHLNDIFEITKFELEKKEIAWINSLNNNTRLRYDPDTCDFSRL